MKLFLASIATGIFVTTSTFMTVVFVRALFKDEASVMLLKEAADGGSPMSPEVARRVIDLFREIKPPKEAEYDLTPHEFAPAADARRRSQLQDGCRGVARLSQHDQVPPASHLRQAASPHEIGSSSKSSPSRFDPIVPFPRLA